MNVSLPVPLRNRLDEKVNRLGSYGSTSDYVRELIRRDLDRDEAREQLDRLISQGAQSPTELVTPEWWQARRESLAHHRRQRSKKPQRKRA